MRYLKFVFYAFLGALLANAGVLASRDWQFWAIIGCVLAVDTISGLTPRAGDMGRA